ncbi:MAG: CDP-alcohol phosphatidyltransferase family protein [Allgaiera sp.]|jgi:phosphatidylglycerophosphate synthase|nr:CDP-alcohol phosphatidyltransferase family protein [Allgaiera sp.]
MLDAPLRRIIDPPLNMMGRALAKTGISADTVTILSLITGLLAALAIALGAPHLALWLVLLSRLADGLDGAVARATTRTDFGGYLDITADFLFYGAIPLAFVIANPATNGLAGALLLTSFYFNGASFLGYAILAERHGLETSERGSKSLYFTGGLLEGAETILFFVLICLLPGWFAPLAWIFGILCFVTAGARIALARQVFAPPPEAE